MKIQKFSLPYYITWLYPCNVILYIVVLCSVLCIMLSFIFVAICRILNYVVSTTCAANGSQNIWMRHWNLSPWDGGEWQCHMYNIVICHFGIVANDNVICTTLWFATLEWWQMTMSYVWHCDLPLWNGGKWQCRMYNIVICHFGMVANDNVVCTTLSFVT